MTTFDTGAYPPGCTQRDVDMAQPGYWPDDPTCPACNNAGCSECCPLEPITLEDLEEIEAQIKAAQNKARLVSDHHLATLRARFHQSPPELLADTSPVNSWVASPHPRQNRRRRHIEIRVRKPSPRSPDRSLLC